MPIRVGIVPHTHWDREWYAPFQTYRLRLIRLLDELLTMLEADPSYARFTLDGQTAVIDDYLEVRPEAAERLRRLAAAGRITVGPWAILMDEFMVSGETLVRNLQAGFARAAELGGVMPVGYLPDMFGHVAQMPQILRLAGLDQAVVWRGVPSAVTGTAFWWEAPDGSRVRAEYLYGSYSNGRDLPDEPLALVERARNYEAEVGDGRLGGLLLMNGTDHHLPEPWVGRLAAVANRMQSEYRFEVTTLGEYLAGEPTDGLPTWPGELRSGARANLLMGVASNRVDVKRAAAAAEQALERRAEPLAALFLPPAAWPGRLLALAWRNLILNSAHDSSCACSHDEVVEQVMVRYREARQVGEGIAAESVAALAGEVDAPRGAVVVVNPSSASRSGLVEVFVPGSGPVHFVAPDGSPRSTQVLGEHSAELFSARVSGRKLLWVLDMARGREFGGRPVASWDLAPALDGSGHEVTIVAAPRGFDGSDVAALRQALSDLVAGEEPVRVRMREGPRRHVLVETGSVPGFGWTTLTPVEGPGPGGPVTAGEKYLDNGLVRVAVDPAGGTFAVATADGMRLEGLNRYVDGGDGGDTYNWSPPEEDRLVSSPEEVTVTALEPGPLRARLLISSRYRWPSSAEGDERACTARARDTVTVEVRTTIEVRAGDPVVGLEVEVDNQARDHRLRAHFPLPVAVSGSDAECAFAVVRRGLDAEGGPGEHGLPTFPARRFVDCSDGAAGLALLADGLLEYEVVAGGTEVALTLLRAVGYLSRLEPHLRPNAAGPPVPVEDAQMPGRQRRRYGVLLHRGDWRGADLYRRADEFLLPLESAAVTETASTRLACDSALRVEGAEVSAVLRDNGALVVRCFNPSPQPATLRVERDGLPEVGWSIDLNGALLEPFEGTRPLRPWEIATLRLG
jgi:mannosylglycerate hydrolase